MKKTRWRDSLGSNTMTLDLYVYVCVYKLYMTTKLEFTRQKKCCHVLAEQIDSIGIV